MSKQYTILVEKDPESGWYVAEVAELPGCFTQAPDLSSLEKNAREAIAVYLETVVSDEPQPEFVGTWKVEMPA